MSNPIPPPAHVNLTGAEIAIGGDVAGRDKVVNHTTVVTVTGAPARWAVTGLAAIAGLAVLALAFLALRGAAVIPAATATAGLPAGKPTDPPRTATAPPATSTSAPLPSATPTRPAPTATARLISPTPLFDPTEPAAPTATASTPPTPRAAAPLYDAFNDRCLDAQRWALAGAVTDAAGCLDASRQFFTEGRAGQLAVFLALEAEHAAALTQTPAGCFSEASVTLALDAASFYTEQRQVYLSVGATLPRQDRTATLEVRVRASNYPGRPTFEIAPRYTEPGGTLDFTPLPYLPGRPVTITFRVEEVGAHVADRPAGANQRLTVWVDDQPLAPALSLSGPPCALTLGYQAEAETVLEGYFEEARLQPAD